MKHADKASASARQNVKTQQASDDNRVFIWVVLPLVFVLGVLTLIFTLPIAIDAMNTDYVVISKVLLMSIVLAVAVLVLAGICFAYVLHPFVVERKRLRKEMEDHLAHCQDPRCHLH